MMESRRVNKHTQRFCQVALALGFVTEDRIKEALNEQVSNDPARRLRPHKLVGEIMLEKGWLTVRQIEMILSQASKVKL